MNSFAKLTRSEHYNYFRDYDPSVGRYTTSDPIGLDGGLNSYSYVDSTPLSNSDPLGLSPLYPGEQDPRNDHEQFDAPAQCWTEAAIVAWCVGAELTENVIAGPAEQIAEQGAERFGGILLRYAVSRAFVLDGVVDAATDLPRCINKLKKERLCDTTEECEFRNSRRKLSHYLASPSGAR